MVIPSSFRKSLKLRAFSARQSWPLIPLLLVVLLGCPPARENIDPQESSSALLLSVYYPTQQISAATLLIPRETGMTCEFSGYSLADDDEDFLSIRFARGDLYEWAGEYAASGVTEECSGNNYYYYYSPSLEDQRCLYQLSGVDSQGQPAQVNENSLLRITSYDLSRVTGSIRAADGETEYFTATNCGERMQYGYTDGNTTQGRETPPSPWALRFR